MISSRLIRFLRFGSQDRHATKDPYSVKITIIIEADVGLRVESVAGIKLVRSASLNVSGSPNTTIEIDGGGSF